MNNFKFLKYAAAIVCCVLSLSLVSCDDDDEPKNALKCNPAKVEVAPQATATVTVSGGVAPYTATSSDAEIVTTSVEDNTVTLTGVKDGNATIIIHDKNQLTGQVAVVVKAATGLTFDKSTTEVSVGKEAIVNVKSGTAPYTVAVKDASIATATVKDAEITIKGVKAGTTTVTVTDKDKKTGTITVTVKK